MQLFIHFSLFVNIRSVVPKYRYIITEIKKIGTCMMHVIYFEYKDKIHFLTYLNPKKWIMSLLYNIGTYLYMYIC